MGNYGTPPVALTHGQGCTVWDADGRAYTDLIAGIAVSSLGHAHPAIVEAVTRQVGKLAHSSNLFLHEPEILLAERLRALLAAGRSARPPGVLHQLRDRGERGRHQAGPAPAGPRAAGIRGRRGRLPRPHHGRPGADREELHPRAVRPVRPRRRRSCRTGTPLRSARRSARTRAAVFLEPCLGEGGVVPPPAGYLAAAREACDGAGALLVLDEIQSGIGRTGTWFAHQADGCRAGRAHPGQGPRRRAADRRLHRLRPSAAPRCARATTAAPSAATRWPAPRRSPCWTRSSADGLLARAAAVGGQLASGLAEIQHPLLAGVRGRGLWLAALLTEPAAVRGRGRGPGRPASWSTRCSRTRSGWPRR